MTSTIDITEIQKAALRSVFPALAFGRGHGGILARRSGDWFMGAVARVHRHEVFAAAGYGNDAFWWGRLRPPPPPGAGVAVS